MKFDIKYHDQIPKEFSKDAFSDDPKTTKHASASTHYDLLPENRPKLYGMECGITAKITSDFKTKFLGRTIEKQHAVAHIAFFTEYDGYERAPGQTLFATAETSQNPEKKQVAEKLRNAMQIRFASKGLKCEQTPSLTIHLPGNKSPIEEIEDIVTQIRTWEKEYDEGGKPLGDIEPPAPVIRVNPHNAAAAGTTHPGEPSIELLNPFDTGLGMHWAGREKKRTNKEIVEAIAGLAHTYFQESEKPIIEFQHKEFGEKLRALFAPSGNEETSLDDLSISGVIRLAQCHFDIGKPSTRQTHLEFLKAVEKIFPQEKGLQ